MLEAVCHCGAVRIRAPRPDQVTDCNCSLCSKLGVLWAYYSPREVRFTAGKGTTVAYIQGHRTLAAHHCPTCGCTTHWLALDPAADRMAVNARLINSADLAGVRVRRFDGAESWTDLD